MSKPSRLVKWTVPVLAIAFFWQAPATFAESLNELQQQQHDVESKKNELNASLDDTKSELQATTASIEALTKKIEELSEKITATNTKITDVTNAIQQTTEDMNALQASIELLEEKIKVRDILLADRARAIQAGDSISYVDVVLGASSFTDLIDRFSAVNTLIEADRNIMEQQRTDKAELEAQKASLAEKKAQQEQQKNELETLQADLTKQKEENNGFIDELEAQQDSLYKEKSKLETDFSEALNLEQSIESAIIEEQARLAELARIEAERKAAEKAAAEKAAAEKAAAEKVAAEKAAAARAKNDEQTATEQVATAYEEAEVAVPDVAEGTWVRPAAGRFTSGFGWRDIGDGPEYHYGIDIANPIGTPIVASHAGTVTYASTMGGYGKVIMLQHVIDGETYSSVYAHLNSFSVSVGDTVATGQKIGEMGNTGRSTGPHLHFEIHTGPWRGQEPGAMNPLRYISL